METDRLYRKNINVKIQRIRRERESTYLDYYDGKRW